MTSTMREDPNPAVIQRHSVASQVYLDLRSKILTGEIPQGERIVESTIARTLNISRAPVREAVNRLTEAGLLENRTHYGPSVIQMEMAAIRELYAVRIALETLAIRTVAVKHSNEDIAALRGLVAEMAERADAGDLVGVVEKELEFHEAILHMSGNPYIVKVATMLFDHLRLALTVDNAGYGSLDEVVREHEPLIEAIVARDPERAAKEVETHIMASLDTYAGR